jgi:hypothetical protein
VNIMCYYCGVFAPKATSVFRLRVGFVPLMLLYFGGQFRKLVRASCRGILSRQP